MFEKDIQELIKKNLPEYAAQELAKFMSNYVDKEKKLKEAEETIILRNNTISTKDKTINELNNKIKENEDINTRNIQKEIELKKRESELFKKEIRIEVLEEQIRSANCVTNRIFELVSTVFRNKQLISEQTTIPLVHTSFGYDGKPTGTYVNNENKSITKTIENE